MNLGQTIVLNAKKNRGSWPMSKENMENMLYEMNVL